MAELVIISTFYAFVLLYKLLKFTVIWVYKILFFILKILANIYAWSLMFPGTRYSGDWEKPQTDSRDYYEEYDQQEYSYYENYQEVTQTESCFDVLGVSPDDDLSTIKQVYRSLSKAYHPDVNKSKMAEEKIKKINDAWSKIQKIKN